MERKTSARRDLAGYGKLSFNRQSPIRRKIPKEDRKQGHEMPNMKNVYTYKYKTITMTKGTL